MPSPLHLHPAGAPGSLLAQAESSLDAIENLCALHPRLADGEIHHTAMLALAAIREGR